MNVHIIVFKKIRIIIVIREKKNLNCRVCLTDRHFESSRGPEYMYFFLIIEVFSGDLAFSSIYGVFRIIE